MSDPLQQEVSISDIADPVVAVKIRRSAKKRPVSATAKMPSALAGRAGVSLVEFQLGRRGFESVRTPPDSKSGDLWAETGAGRVSIEVKTTVRGNAWFIKSKQTGSEFFCLVSLDEAFCYVVTRDDIQRAISLSHQAYPGVFVVAARSLPAEGLEGWHLLGGQRMKSIMREQRRAVYKTTRRVTVTLADGTVKTYTYAPKQTPGVTASPSG